MSNKCYDSKIETLNYTEIECKYIVQKFQKFGFELLPCYISYIKK